jgi:hypothetical protein
MADGLILVYALPCEKAILSKAEQLSLIGLIEAVEIKVTPEAPERFIAPMRWSVASLWRRDENAPEEVRSYEQRTVLLDKDGDDIFTNIHKFDTQPGYQFFRNIVDFPGMPIAQSGPIVLETHLRENTSEEWTQYGSYTIHINRQLDESEVKHVATEPA